MDDWCLHHPVAKRMRDYGFDDSIQQNVAMLVYLDLCEAKGWYQVDVHPSHELRMVFLTAKEFKRSRLQIVVPLSLEYRLSMSKLDDFAKTIRIPSHLASTEEPEPNIECGAVSRSSIIIAIAESGSTIVYYYLHCGLHPPTEGSLSKKLTQPLRKDERKARKRRRQKDGGKKQENREKKQKEKESDEQLVEVNQEGTSKGLQTDAVAS